LDALIERGFDLERDVSQLLALVGRARATADPHAFLHPGGLQWLLRRLGRRATFGVLRWMEGDALAGFAVDDSGYLMVQGTTSTLDHHLTLLDRAEAHLRQRGEAEVEISVWDDDRELLAEIRSLGYEPSGTHGYELVHDLADAHPRPLLPDGFSMRWLEPQLDDAYVDLHRAAWSTRAPSDYDGHLHAVVTSMPDFERKLVPIVAAADGTLAASCIAWFDPRTLTVEIEPLGTRPEFRRLGLARAVVHEVLDRSAERGAKSVMVWGVSANPAAVDLYKSAGFRSQRVLREHRRRLGGP
jgi:GNAT superfamily N-acetyltransferase